MKFMKAKESGTLFKVMISINAVPVVCLCTRYVWEVIIFLHPRQTRDHELCNSERIACKTQNICYMAET